MSTPEKYEKYPFVVGLEFGAITSGISIAHKDRSVDIYNIDNRPVANNTICKQIPTSILYKDGDITNPDKIFCDIQESEKEIRGGDIYIKNIKEIAYNLDGSETDHEYIKSKGLTSQKIVADYLRSILQIAVKNLEHVKFAEEHKPLFENFKVEDARYCVACPQEQEIFLSHCFIEAGIINDEDELLYRLDFVTESEATAYNLLAWDRRNSEIIASENYLVCNLGHTSLGISEIKADTTEALSQVRLIDEYPGEGSMLLEKAFSSLVKEKVETLRLNVNTVNGWMEKFVEEKKYGFDEIPIEETVDQLIVGGENETVAEIIHDFDTVMTSRELSEKVFNPAVQTFVKIILDAMEKGENKNNAIYKNIYLTGRYSHESYFLEKLMKVENGRYSKDIILIDYEIINSVSRGAVHYAMRKKPVQIPFLDVKEKSIDPIEEPKDIQPKIKECDFIVGIDFGTTYSGISYSVPGAGKPIIPFERWPKQPANNITKCPTVIIYNKKYDTTKLWGNKAAEKTIKSDGHKLALFKLCLSPEATLEQYREETEGKVQRLLEKFDKTGITADKAIMDYIKAITDHVKASIHETQDGKNALAKLVGKIGSLFKKTELDIVYVLTVPAMWDEDAKRTMVNAALGSGIINSPDNLLIITEPEAAALSYEGELKEYENADSKTFLICDAGGGTVDLVTFRLERDDNGELIIRQLCQGDGDLCGSTELDRNFEAYIRNFYQHDLERDARLVDLTDVVKQFKDKIKPNFDYCKSNPGTERILLPEEPDLSYLTHGAFLPNTGNQILKVSHRDLAEKVYDPVIEKVINLLNLQMERLEEKDQPDVILMVGGFSSSSYLEARLKSKFQPKIEIKVHPRPLTAVSEGAVSYGQNPRMISSKLIGQSYAIEVKTRFEDNVDRLSNKIEDLDGGKQVFYSKSRLEYFVYCGKSAKKNSLSKFQKRVYVEYPNNAIIAIFTSDINPEEIEDENRLRYVDPELHKKFMEINVRMPVFEGAEPKEKIPFLISLEVDEITGVKVIVKCEKGDTPPYEVSPKVYGKPLLYICEKGPVVKPKIKTNYSAPLPSASRS